MRDEAMPRIKAIGQYLRTTRQERGEDLYDIADFLRIRPSYLFALEEGDLDAMPGRPYAFGFMRSYADYLGFDGHAVVAEVKGLLEGVPPARIQAPRRPVESRRPAWSLVTACIILLVAALGAWKVVTGGHSDTLSRIASLPGQIGAYLSSVIDSDRDIVQPLPPPAQVRTASGTALPPATKQDPVVDRGRDEPEIIAADPKSDEVAEETPPPATDGEVVAEVERIEAPESTATVPVIVRQIDVGNLRQPAPAVEAGLPERLASSPAGETVEVEPLDQALLDKAQHLASDTVPQESQDPVSANASEISRETATALLGRLQAGTGNGEQRVYGEPLADARVVLVARESSWIQIKSSERDYIRSRTLEPGDRFALPNRNDLALWTGNAGGLEVVVDGRNLGRLGSHGAVMRDVALSPEMLLANLR